MIGKLTASPTVERSARGGQLKKSVQVFAVSMLMIKALQLFALILADNVAAERGEFYGDLFLGHRIARIALWNVDPRRM